MEPDLPLTGLNVCITGIDTEREEIVAKLVQMGADYKSDLRSDVTHLVVAERSTEKYKFAARHRMDIQFMHVEWVNLIWDAWLAGRDITEGNLRECGKLPIFSSMNVCVTNIEQDERKEIEKLLKENGADYRPDLTRDCTHLIAAATSGKKYEFAKRWGRIHIVSPDWVAQSISRGAALGEEYFNMELPDNQRGQGAWQPISSNLSSRATNSKRKRMVWKSSSSDSQPIQVRKQFKAKVDDILSQVLSNQKSSQNPKQDQKIVTEEQKMKYAPTVSSGCKSFVNLQFTFHRFTPEQNKVLSAAILRHGGMLVDGGQPIEIIPHWAVVPYSLTSKEFKLYESRYDALVTELWVERCIFTKRFLDPKICPLSSLYPGPYPRDEMHGLTICVSGFSGVDVPHMSKYINLLGGTFFPIFSKSRSLLIASEDASRQKIKRALQWGIPIVSLHWLIGVLTGSNPQETISSYLAHDSSSCMLNKVDSNANPNYLVSDQLQKFSVPRRSQSELSLKSRPKLDKPLSVHTNMAKSASEDRTIRKTDPYLISEATKLHAGFYTETVAGYNQTGEFEEESTDTVTYDDPEARKTKLQLMLKLNGSF